MILLIDGSSLLSTNYYATLPRELMFEKDPEKREKLYEKIMHSDDGRYTNGVLGFMRALTKMMELQNPSHVFIAFDRTRATFRRDLYTEYKGQRKETPKPLKEQFGTIQELLKDTGFAVESSSDYEADDLVGSVVELYKCTEPIRIWTKDQDYFQLVDDENDVRIWMPFDKEKIKEMNENYRGIMGYDPETFKNCTPDNCFEFTEDTVEAHFSVRPNLVVDYKAIAGDTSDNIPGVKGVSSAAPLLLNEYGSLEAILDAIDECEGDKKAEKELNTFWKEDLGISRSPMNAFKQYREDGLISKKLAKIKTDCPVEHDFDSMRIENVDHSIMNKWFSDLGMKSLMK